MATEITLKASCINCRHSRYEYAPGAFITNPHLYDCKRGRLHGTLCDRWLPVRDEIVNKIWKADQAASNRAIDTTARQANDSQPNAGGEGK